MTETTATEQPGYMQEYETYWKEIVEHPDGTLNKDQVARELADAATLQRHLSEVYSAVSGEAVSKPFTLPSVVIEMMNERIEAARAEGEGKWYIATGPLAEGGAAILGPFCSQALALDVRGYMEKVNAPATYWVDESA